MVIIKRKFGQSNFDICLQYYGTLDLIIKLCLDNLINVHQIIEEYYIDESVTKNAAITGYEYKTLYQAEGNRYISQSNQPYVSQSLENYIYE